MDEHPLVSVVIPAFNAEKYIAECLDSVLGQDYQAKEVIVVDDGSTDGTLSILNNYAQTHPHDFRFVTAKNGGPAAARNLGISVSNGDLIAFQDADDLWLPGKLSSQVKLLSENPDCHMAYSGRHWVNDDGTPLDNPPEQTQFPSGDIFPHLIETNPITTSTAVVRRSCLDEVGCFDESPSFHNCQDYHLWLRIASEHLVCGSAEKLIKYRVHENNRHKNIEKRFLGMMACVDFIENSPYWTRADKGLFRDAIDRRRSSLARAYAYTYFYAGEFDKARSALRIVQEGERLHRRDKLLSFLLMFPNQVISALQALRTRLKQGA